MIVAAVFLLTIILKLFWNRRTIHGSKYMRAARRQRRSNQQCPNAKTVAPDSIQRLISEEMVEGDQLKWTVRVTGDPLSRVC
ncbi:hypothetical protein ANCCAN_19821 [Ancylostoma caninum]|uniref:Uncharacterized protein n=1 Tax=Ancylostoma caninum TaxID=29170 RepID=A0A368FU63_ANCCA|nr:hypothetical protein ANCCAN_19821 [Ancylostoma caninum]